jgi:hypothetical protein
MQSVLRCAETLGQVDSLPLDQLKAKRFPKMG